MGRVRAAREKRPVVIIAMMAFALGLIAAAVVALVVRGDDSSGKHPAAHAVARSGAADARAAVDTVGAYYGALHAGSGPTAFALLCSARSGLPDRAAFLEVLAQDIHTGTGIREWQPVDGGVVISDRASVSGRLTLDNRQVYAIRIDLVRESAGWRVCSSSLGGVLPDPGSGVTQT